MLRKYHRHRRNFRQNNGRNWDDPQYKKWRKAVYKRDGYCCQWPDCQCKKNLNAHHIKKWEDHPLLRFELWNGITLCYRHHKQIKGQEENYEALFLRMTMNEI